MCMGGFTVQLFYISLIDGYVVVCLADSCSTHTHMILLIVTLKTSEGELICGKTVDLSSSHA